MANSNEILFRLGVESAEGKAAFNSFVSNMVTGLKNAEKGFKDLQSVTATTSKVLEDARKKGESYSASLDRQSKERIEIIQAEQVAYEAALLAIQKEQIDRVKGDKDASDKILAIHKATAAEIAESQKRAADAIRKTQQEFKSDGLAAKFGALKKFVSEASEGLKELGPYVATLAAIGAGLVKLSADAAQYAKEQTTIAKATGLSADATAGLSLALKNIGGNANDAVDLVGQFVGVAQQGGEDAEKAFRTFGVELRDSNGAIKDSTTLLLELDKGYGRVQDAGARTAASQKIFGEQGAKQFAALAGNIGASIEQARRLGLVLDDAAKAKLALFTASVNEAKAKLDAFGLSAGTKLAPAFVSALDAAENFGLGSAVSFASPLASVSNLTEAIYNLATGYDRANEQAAFNAKLTAAQTKETQANKVAVDLLTKSVADLERQTESSNQQLQAQQQAAAAETERLVADRVITEQKAAEQTAAINKQINDQLILNAEERVRKLQELVAKSSDPAFVKETNAKIAQAQIDLESARTAAVQQGTSDRQAIEAAAAEDFQRNLQKVSADFDTELQKRNDQIELTENLGVVSHKEAEEQRLAATLNRIAQEAIALNQRLQAENVGLEERKSIEDRLYQLQVNYDRAKIDSNKASIQARIKDEEERAAKVQAITDQEIAKNQVLIAQKKEQGASAEEIGRIEEDSARRQLAAVDALISAKRREREIQIAAITDAKQRQEAESSANLELIPLETKRIQLAEALRQAHLRATGAVVDGSKQAAQGAVDYINKYSQSLEELQSNLLGLIEKTKKSVVDASGGIGKAIDDINKTAAGSISTILSASLDKIQGYVDEALQRYRDAAEYNARAPIQIAGLFQLQFEKAAEVLKAAFAKRDELFAAEARKQEEAFQKQQEADIAARTAAQKELEDLEEEHADRLKDIHKDIRNVRRDLAADEKKEREDSAAEVARIETDAANARIRRETENNARILAERKKLAADLADAERQSQTDLLDAQAEGIVDRAKLEEQLKKQETEGDTEGAGKTKKALDRLTEDEALAQEKADAEKLAREKATSAEELKILLDGIDEKFRNQKQYLDQVRELEDLGRADQIAKLTENFTKQQEVIAKAQADALKALTDRLAAEQKAREDAAAAEDKAFADRVQKEKDDSKTRLDNLKTAANERIDELKKDLKREQTAFDEAATEIEKRVQALNDKILGIIKPAQDALAGLGGQAPAGGSTPGEGGGNSTSGPVDTPPPSPPAPGAGTPPSGGTQSGGGGELKDKAKAAQARAFIDGTLKLLTRLQNDPEIAAGIVTDLKELAGKTDEFLRIKGLSAANKRDLTDIKAVLGFIISRTAQPDIATGPAKIKDKPTESGQTQAGQTGGPVSTPKPKFTDKPTEPGQKADIPTQKRDAAFADSLVFRADSAKSKDEAKKIQDEAQAALKSGKIDADDFNRIKARLGYASFQGGFELPPSFNPSGTPAGGLGGGPALPTGTIPAGGGSRAVDSNPISAAGGSSGATPPGTAAGQKGGVSVNIGSLNVNDIQAAIDAFGEALKEEFRKKGIPV